MHVIYEALKKTNGDTDGEKLIAAAKGMKWDSIPVHVDRPGNPRRGPDHLHPQGREGGRRAGQRAVDKIENVKDPK